MKDIGIARDLLVVSCMVLTLFLMSCDSRKKAEQADKASVEEKTAEGKVSPAVVAEGRTVKVHYVLTVDGEFYDSTRDIDPLEFTVGSNQVIPGFERALLGLKAGDRKSFTVPPEEGFGPEYPNAIRTIPKEQLPPGNKPEVGMTLNYNAPDGQNIPGRIVEVKKDVVVANFNYPLAGKTLNYDAEVVEVR